MKKCKFGLAGFCLIVLLSSGVFTQDVLWDNAFQYDVPYVPTPYEVIEEMFRLAEVKSGDVLYDLGCGDGRIVIEAAKKFGIKGVGIDIDPERIRECQTNAETAGVRDQVTFLNQDLFESDFREASVVTLYLLSSVNYRLRPQLLEQLTPGTRLVSHDFSMRDWRADRDLNLDIEERSHKVYFWIVPANVTGEWSVSLPSGIIEESIHLRIEQKFQDIQAFFDGDDFGFQIRDLKLSGDRVSFVLERKRLLKSRTWILEGRVQAHRMEGELRLTSPGESESLEWSAFRNPASMKPLDPRDSNE